MTSLAERSQQQVLQQSMRRRPSAATRLWRTAKSKPVGSVAGLICILLILVAIFASTKHGLRGLNWQRRFDRSWLNTLGVYRLVGTVRYGTAHASR